MDTSLDASVAGNSLCAPPPVNLASGSDSPARRRRVSRRLVVLANGQVCVWATRGRHYHQVHMTFCVFLWFPTPLLLDCSYLLFCLFVAQSRFHQVILSDRVYSSAQVLHRGDHQCRGVQHRPRGNQLGDGRSRGRQIDRQGRLGASCLR